MNKSFLTNPENKYPVVSNVVHDLIHGLLNNEKSQSYIVKTNKIETTNNINKIMEENIRNYNNETISLEVFSQNLFNLYCEFKQLNDILLYIENNYIYDYSMCINVLIDMENENINNLILNYLYEKSSYKQDLIPGFIYRMGKEKSEMALKIKKKYEENAEFKKELDFYFN